MCRAYPALASPALLSMSCGEQELAAINRQTQTSLQSPEIIKTLLSGSLIHPECLQVSERSTDIDLVREAVHQKRSLRASAASARRTSSKSSVRIPSTNTSTDNLDTISVVERQTAETPGTGSGRDKVRTLQARPLPDLPPTPASQPASATDGGAIQTSNNPELEDLNASLSKFQMRFVFMLNVNIDSRLFV